MRRCVGGQQNEWYTSMKYAHRESHIRDKVDYHKINHVVDQRVHLDHLANNLRYLLDQCLGLVGPRRSRHQRK